MRKHKLPDELARLTPSELEEVNAWLRKFTYRKVQELIAEKHGVRINHNKLCRHYQRLQQADDLAQSSGLPMTVPGLLSIQNAEPLPDEQITHSLKLHALRLASSPHLDAYGLKHLFQLFTYEDRRSAAEKRAAHDAHLNEIRERRLELKELQALALESVLPANISSATERENAPPNNP